MLSPRIHEDEPGGVLWAVLAPAKGRVRGPGPMAGEGTLGTFSTVPPIPMGQGMPYPAIGGGNRRGIDGGSMDGGRERLSMEKRRPRGSPCDFSYPFP